MFRAILAVVAAVLVTQVARADIYRWDNGEVIPGTEGIEPGPGVHLNDRELEFAALQEIDLTESQFTSSNLTSAHLYRSNLTGANLDGSTLTQANLSEAVVTGASFIDTTSRGFAQAQLKSTASYQAKNLTGIVLGNNNLTGWDLSGQNLTNASLYQSTLTQANLSGANLTNTYLVGSKLTYADLNGANLTSANLTGAILASARLNSADLSGADFSESVLTDADLENAVVTDADFGNTVTNRGGGGFKMAQLYSTESYRTRNLQGIKLSQNDLSGWDFSRQDLSRADLSRSTLMNAGFVDAIITGANLSQATARGFTKGHLYSTHSYKNQNLRGVRIGGWIEPTSLIVADLNGWDFRSQDLTNAVLEVSSLTGADFSDALVQGTNLNASGLTKEQLYSTASYRSKNLQGIGLCCNNMRGWNLSGQNLTGANLGGDLAHADLSGAVVAGAQFYIVAKEQLYSTASYSAKNLVGIRITGASDLTWSDFRHQNLQAATLRDVKLNHADLSGANLNAAFVASVDLSYANLRDSVLSDVAAIFTSLSGADLSGADLTRARLNNSSLRDADLTGAIVAEASFWNTGLNHSQLYSTSSYQMRELRGIQLDLNLSGANLYGQNLQDSAMTYVGIRNADLRFADIRGSTGIDATLSRSNNTILPNGGIAGLQIGGAELLVVRNHRGNPERLISPIAIRINQYMSVSEAGTIEFDFDQYGWNSAISFDSSIPVQLGGTLELTFNDDVGIATQVGRTFHIFDWNGVEPTGAFTVSSLYPWDVSKLYSTGNVTLLLPGDTNDDGTVDILDLNSVRNNFGLVGQGVAGDTNLDGVVDILDLSNVRDFFGVTAPQAVPEPSTYALANIGLIGMAGIMRRRKCRARRN